MSVVTLALSRLDWLNLLYLLAAVLFIVGLKMLSQIKTAPRGNLVSAVGMLIATVATFFYLTGGTAISLIWVVVALILGAGIGAYLATTVQMTGMPQMVALLNGFGGIASLLVACGDFLRKGDRLAEAHQAVADMQALGVDLSGYVGVPWHMLLATGLATLIGGVTFTGSIVAFGKLQGGPFWSQWTPGKPIQFPGQKIAIFTGIAVALILSLVLIQTGFGWGVALLALIALIALALGVVLVIGIGGADMPVVISLLNSYSGLAAAMAGFVLGNEALIITGALVGASGIILTKIMCKAMNRSLMNVLFGGVGFEAGAPGSGATATSVSGTVKEMNAEDAAMILEASSLVVVVPGYGMAVAQAQHAVKELADKLEAKGVTVKYGIHPVAGRMPGHMNVLLAEANVPYESLCDLDTINPQFEQTDVVLVIGANDVTNPAARHAKDSPIYGMPILDVDKARTIMVIKRSLNPGFAGIENELYFNPKCSMVFGDAKKVMMDLSAAVDQL